MKQLALCAATLAAISLPVYAADQGVTDTSVLFSQVAALEGPAAALGMGMQQGMTAAFEQANQAGGVHGRMVKLESVDDGYEPDRSAQHVETIIAADASIGLIGPVGTPTTKATQPIASAANFPLIGPFTGAGFLRDASHGNIFNVRATYAAETEEWIRYLVDEQGMSDIAILYQDDGFGRVGLDGVNAALEKRGMELVATGTYTRNTTAVKSALLNIRKKKPDAVVMVGAYKPIAEFIKLSKKLKFNPAFVTISFVGSKALANELGEDGQGVVISQVVPFPWDTNNVLVKEYQAALKAVDESAEPGFVSLEGYVVGRLALKALEDAGQDLTRETFLTALNGLRTIDLDGAILEFGEGDNQGMGDVFLTRILADGTFEPVGGRPGNT